MLIVHLDIYISLEKCLFKFFAFKKIVVFVVVVVELQKFYIYPGFSHYFFLSLLLSFRALNYMDFKVPSSGH